MEINVEHILDCLDQYGKGELTEEQLVKALTYDEKNVSDYASRFTWRK